MSFEVHHDDHLGGRSLLDIFDKMTWKEWSQRVSHGLKQPRDTGEYKWAKTEVTRRVLAPMAAILVPGLVVLALMTIKFQDPEPRTTEVTMLEPETVEELDEQEEIEEIIEEIPEPQDFEFSEDTAVADNNVTSMDAPFSPQPTEMDAVAIVKSPVIFRGMLGSRNPGSRGSMLAAHGGNAQTEGAVMRALRWLKKTQKNNGSWGTKNQTALTCLSLLTYLAHGETPASEEFGETVEKAIRFIVQAQEDSGHFAFRDGHDYTHPIAAYALCEAFAMTRVPMVKYAAEKALNLVVKGQHQSGGWNYNLNQDDRDDTSYMGWCVQAVKAGSLAGLEVEGLEEAKKRAILGMKKNYGTGAKSNMGGFGYTSPNAKHGLTGVGVLCMQLLGAGNAKEAQGGLRTLEASQCIWGEKGFHNDNYFWYYITQAKFHTGGDTWVKWNKTFSPVLVKNQTVIPKEQSGYVDHKGEPQQIGWWEMPEENAHHTAGPVMDTTLAALQLQVYYRYLPTFKTPKVDDLAKAGFEADDDEIEIELIQ